jgi:O-antigen ligase
MLVLAAEKINSRFLKIISIICSFLVPLLVTGPFLPDLLVSSLSLWFLYYSLKNKIYNIYRNIYFYFFVGFWFTCILSSLLSDDILFSLKASLFYIRIGIFALLISYLISQNKIILDYFYYAFLITFSALIIDGYFQYFTGFNLFGFPLSSSRVSSFFGDELILGSYLARLSPLFLALFIVRSNKQFLEIFFISIIFIFIYILIFLAGERASFVLINLSIILTILFMSNYRWLRVGILIISLCIVTFLIFKDKKLYYRYIETPIKSFGLNSPIKYFFTPEHDSLIRTSWNMFLDKPILGHGPKIYRVKCGDPKYATGVFPCHTHPHNFYVQLLAETGLIGFLFLAGLFFYFIYLLIKHVFEHFIHKRKYLSDYKICLLSGLLITIWPITTNGNIFTNYLMLFYSLQMGFFKKDV